LSQSHRNAFGQGFVQNELDKISQYIICKPRLILWAFFVFTTFMPAIMDTLETTELEISRQQRNKITLLIAFAGVYILWGSTYLAIRVVLQTIPLCLMAGSRFLIAGIIMLVWGFLAKHQFPSKIELKRSAVSGILLLVLGNAGVLYANRFVSTSGIIAVVVAITPFWVVLLQWLMNRNKKPALSVWIGIALGMIGMAVLAGPENLKGIGANSHIGIAVILVSTLCWAIGTLYAGAGSQPSSPAYNASFQMLSASIVMFVLATATSEWQTFDATIIDEKSIFSFWYLVIGGSVLGFTAFMYIARNASPASATTYAYVNPVIALFLGWWLGNETINLQTIIASCLLVGAVALVVTKPRF